MHHNHQYIAAGASNDTLLIAPPPKADAAPMSQVILIGLFASLPLAADQDPLVAVQDTQMSKGGQ